MSVFSEFAIVLSVSVATCALVYFVFSNWKLQSRAWLTPASQILTRPRADRIFLFLVLVYIMLFSALSIFRHLSMHSGGYDLGIFDQAIWNSLQGRILEFSLVPDTPTLLGQRFDPILLALVPLYAAPANPVTLLIVQSIALGLAAFPIYWFARAQMGPGFALALATSYFLYPPLQYVNLFDFHEVALSSLFLSFATFFLLRQHYLGMLICLMLALLTKEEIAFTVIFFGAFIFFIQRQRWLGAGLAAAGALWGVIAPQYVIPYFRGGDFGATYYYFGHGINSAHRYDYLGADVPEVATTLLTRPDIVLPEVLIPAKLEYILQFLVPLMFVPLVGIELAALAAPTLGINILSHFLAQYTIETHYAAVLLPFPFFAAALGIRRILNWRGAAIKPALLAMLISASALNYFFHAPGPLSQRFDANDYTITPHVLAGYSLMNDFPPEASLVTQKQLAPHLTHRRKTFEFPFVLDYRQSDILFLDTTSKWYTYLRDSWDEWFSTGYFEKVKEQDGYLIARRISPSQTLGIEFEDKFTLLGYTLPLTQTLRGGQTLRPIVAWRTNQDIQTRYAIRATLIDASGHVWAEDEREPHGGFSHTDEWTGDHEFGDQYVLALPSTMPPGDYRISIGVKNIATQINLSASKSSTPLGDDAMIAILHIEKDKSNILASKLLGELVRDQKSPYVLFVDMQELRFLGHLISRETVSPGEQIQIGLYWRARAKPRGDYLVAVQLRDPNDRVAFEQSARPAAGAYPTTLWDEGEVLLDWHDLTLSSSLAHGSYQIHVVLRDAMNGMELGRAVIGTIVVQ